MTTKNVRDALSLVLITRNRPTYLRRILTYYKNHGMRLPFIVADSSDASVKAEIANLVDEFSNGLNLDLRSYDSNIPPGRKFTDALSHVKTDFFTQEQDDDFHIPQWFDRGVDFLRNNPDFAAVHGHGLNVKVEQDKAFGSLEYVIPLACPKTLDQGRGSERILAFMSKYIEVNQCIHRTESHLRNWVVTETNQPDLPFTELTPNCLAVIQGKVKQLPGLFTVRQFHLSQTSKSFGTTLDWMATPDFGNQYARFRDCLAAVLSEKDGIPLETARATIHQGFGWLVSDWLAQTHLKPKEHEPPAPQTGLRARLKKMPGLHKSWSFARSLIKPPPPPATLLTGAGGHLADFLPIYELITGERQATELVTA